MLPRLLALLGSIAFGIRAFFSGLLGLVGLQRLAVVVVPALIVGFAVGAVLSARETLAIVASRPEVQQTTLHEVATRGGEQGTSIWFEFDALIDETSYEIPADLGTFFYLARDPENPQTGLLVRSPLNDTFFRQRTLTATLTEDPALVEEARGALGNLPGGFSVDNARYLDEVATGGDQDAALIPSELDGDASGTEVLITGRVISPSSFAACAASSCDGDDAPWFYYLADPEGAGAIVLRSPHPPNAIPVRLQGLYQRDTFDLQPVLDSEWFASIDADVPTERAFSAGRRPPILVPASWTPTILFAIAAVVLLASWLAGYPVFGRSAPPAPARGLAVGEGVDLEISGKLARDDASIRVVRSPAALERISIQEMALRMWRYGLLPRDLSRREAEARFMAEASGETDRLVLHERDQSALVTIGADGARPEIEVGRLYRVGPSSPAIRFRQGRSDVVITTRTTDERDRVAAEILARAG